MRKEIFTDKNKIVLMIQKDTSIRIIEKKNFTFIEYNGEEPRQVITPENESHKDLLAWIIIALFALYVAFNCIYLFTGGKL
jgi:hypothetical protein